MLEYIHSKGLIVRDVRPSNFAMELGEKSAGLFMFDFGLAKLYREPLTGAHIPYREGRGRKWLGTPRYASYNMHFGRGGRLELNGNTF